MTSTVKMESAALMDRYYDRRALSSISEVPFFKFDAVAWGKGFVTYDENGKPVVTTIPTNVSEIEGEFHRNKPLLSYTNGIITLRASISVGELPVGVNEEFTALYATDDEGGVIAAFAVQPIWMNNKRSLVVEGTLEIGRD
ncbi:hypothetical protein [Vibrio campbellii]|uniref:hypothetical protein n=1 Tax=Vibrio campbellii TaxID=680 RepID=UPI00210B90F1|nr:hypothetical protein [Vibrio campbellii]UTZ44610.1 hypothetical protein HB764_25460 [Vibrio campbellii]